MCRHWYNLSLYLIIARFLYYSLFCFKVLRCMLDFTSTLQESPGSAVPLASQPGQLFANPKAANDA